MDFLPDKIDIKASLQTQDDRKFHELSGYLIISRKLKCFDDNIIKILIPIFAFQGYIRDNRRPYEKHLAVYVILASILLEDVAFYSLDLNLSNALSSNTTFHWIDKHSSTAEDIFDGKYD